MQVGQGIGADITIETAAGLVSAIDNGILRQIQTVAAVSKANQALFHLIGFNHKVPVISLTMD